MPQKLPSINYGPDVAAEQDRTQLGAALFNPRTVALVGASADVAKLASRTQRVLRKRGFTSTIIPINPGRSEINGDRAYPNIGARIGISTPHSEASCPFSLNFAPRVPDSSRKKTRPFMPIIYA